MSKDEAKAKAMLEPKMRGRPRKKLSGTPENLIEWNDSYCQQLIDHMSEGHSFASFAGVVGVGASLLYRWLESHIPFQTAKDIGESKSLLHWEKLGMQGIFMGKDFGHTTYVFTMKNKFGWRDRTEVQNVHHGNIVHHVTQIDNLKLKEAVKKDVFLDFNREGATDMGGIGERGDGKALPGDIEERESELIEGEVAESCDNLRSSQEDVEGVE